MTLNRRARTQTIGLARLGYGPRWQALLSPYTPGLRALVLTGSEGILSEKGGDTENDDQLTSPTVLSAA
jgi:hypothetical protein